MNLIYIYNIETVMEIFGCIHKCPVNGLFCLYCLRKQNKEVYTSFDNEYTVIEHELYEYSTEFDSFTITVTLSNKTVI